MRKPRPQGAAEAFGDVWLPGSDTANSTPQPSEIQAKRLARQFGLPTATALATALLAFGEARS